MPDHPSGPGGWRSRALFVVIAAALTDLGGVVMPSRSARAAQDAVDVGPDTPARRKLPGRSQRLGRNRTALRARPSLAVAGVSASVAALLVALGVSRHDEPRLPELELAASTEVSTPTVTSPFALDHLDLECQMSHTIIDKPHVHHAPPPPTTDQATETTSTDTAMSVATAPGAVLKNERSLHNLQRSAQDVADNITAYFGTYSDRSVSRLTIEVAEQHGDSAQLAGRFDGRLQFLASVRQWPDGTWDWLNQITCDELWVTA